VASEGTVVFTSHDRSFMQRVATTVIEVKDGRVVNFLGDYAAYLASVTGEIDAAEAADESRRGKGPGPRKASPPPAGGAKPAARPGAAARDTRKQIATLEKSIARLDGEKKALEAELLSETDPGEALRLHTAMTDVATRLTAAEEEWLELQERAGAE